MVFLARSIALLTVPALAVLALAGPAAAQETGGFFSRFIPSFGSTPAPASAPSPASPTSATKPNVAAASQPVSKPSAVEAPSDPTEANPFTSGGGGLMSAINGRHSNACDGIVCSLMGGETKGTPEAPPAPAPETTALASARSSPAVDDRVSPRKERCTAPANDPWRCYR